MVKEAVATMQYGYKELRALYNKYAGLALFIAVILHLSIIGIYFLIEYLGQEEEPIYTMRVIKLSELGPPPSITNTETAPQLAISAPSAKPTIGVPVPVPDAEVSPEQTLATQTEMSQQASPVIADLGDVGGGVQIEQDIRIEDEGPPPDFVPVEKQPVPVKQVTPVYPELAQRAQMEGTVWVKIWVDKEGKPKKAVVIKSDAEIFNQAAVDAAMQWVFTPAIMNNGPVAVWVAIPFKFRLKN